MIHSENILCRLSQYFSINLDSRVRNVYEDLLWYPKSPILCQGLGISKKSPCIFRKLPDTFSPCLQKQPQSLFPVYNSWYIDLFSTSFPGFSPTRPWLILWPCVEVQKCDLWRSFVFSNSQSSLKVSHHAGHTLKHFCRWASLINPKSEAHPNHHDIAVFITR